MTERAPTWLPIPEHKRGPQDWRIRAWYEYAPETGQVRCRTHPLGRSLRPRMISKSGRPYPGWLDRRGPTVWLVTDVPGEVKLVLAPVASLAVLACLEAGWIEPPPGWPATQIILAPGAKRGSLDEVGWTVGSAGGEVGWVPLDLTPLGRERWVGPRPAWLPAQVRSVVGTANKRGVSDQPHGVFWPGQVREWMPEHALPTRSLSELRPKREFGGTQNVTLIPSQDRL